MSDFMKNKHLTFFKGKNSPLTMIFFTKQMNLKLLTILPIGPFIPG